MTKQQEAHLRRIKLISNRLTDLKYRKGQKQHGGDLFRLSPLMLVHNALDEAIDQVVYLITLRDKMLADLKKAGRKK